ncbi:hypothetical protein [Streptomyces sp. TLI_171]|uniref:hypothetical protein n=1 Tax=Streptomyces sp. TLI_171 TaxID=1938859 RepID=UPI00117EE711|nr:hypothetical protein [Streptomyces sp. TLI_171]
MLSERIAAVDWAAIPTPVLRAPAWATERYPLGWQLPDPVAPLQALAAARTQVQVADAVSRLENTRVLHGHMAAVFPAAVAAAPFLLEIAEQPDAFPMARHSALGLLGEFLALAPFRGFNRIEGTPLCCAVADLIRTRQTFLRSLGQPGRELLQEAGEHWRFEVAETLVDGDQVLAFGGLTGALPRDTARAEDQRSRTVCAVTVEYPPVEDSGDACLRLESPTEVTVGTVLRPAECGEREH